MTSLLKVLVCGGPLLSVIDIVHLDGPSGQIIRQNKIKILPDNQLYLFLLYTIYLNYTSDEIFQRYNFPRVNLILINLTIHRFLIVYVLSFASHFMREDILHKIFFSLNLYLNICYYLLKKQ